MTTDYLAAGRWFNIAIKKRKSAMLERDGGLFLGRSPKPKRDERQLKLKRGYGKSRLQRFRNTAENRAKNRKKKKPY